MKQSTKNQEQLLQAMERQNERIRTLEEKPAKRWDVIVNATLQWLAVAILGAIQFFGKHT
jgi:hypothetical protein